MLTLYLRSPNSGGNGSKVVSTELVQSRGDPRRDGVSTTRTTATYYWRPVSDLSSLSFSFLSVNKLHSHTRKISRMNKEAHYITHAGIHALMPAHITHAGIHALMPAHITHAGIHALMPAHITHAGIHALMPAHITHAGIHALMPAHITHAGIHALMPAHITHAGIHALMPAQINGSTYFFVQHIMFRSKIVYECCRSLAPSCPCVSSSQLTATS